MNDNIQIIVKHKTKNRQLVLDLRYMDLRAIRTRVNKFSHKHCNGKRHTIYAYGIKNNSIMFNTEIIDNNNTLVKIMIKGEEIDLNYIKCINSLTGSNIIEIHGYTFYIINDTISLELDE